MWLPTTASHASARVIDTPTAAGAGAATVLGTKAWLGASRTDQTLLWVATNGDLAGGPVYGINPSKASTDREVVLTADTGPIGLKYMRNSTGVALDAGTGVEQALTTTCDMLAGDGNTLRQEFEGVLLFNVGDDTDVWVVTSGTVVANVVASGALAIGAPLIMDVNGDFTNTGASIPLALAWVAEVVSGAGTAFSLIRIAKQSN